MHVCAIHGDRNWTGRAQALSGRRSLANSNTVSCRRWTRATRCFARRAVQQTWNWVIGSPGQWVIWVIFHVRVTGSSFWPYVRLEFFRFSKKCPKCKTNIWNAEMTKVVVRCLLLDWNHWINFNFYLWLLKILWSENTSSQISRHLEFTIEQGHRVNWVSGSLDSRITGSLGHKMWPSSMSAVYRGGRTLSVINWPGSSIKRGASICQPSSTDDGSQFIILRVHLYIKPSDARGRHILYNQNRIFGPPTHPMVTLHSIYLTHITKWNYTPSKNVRIRNWHAKRSQSLSLFR